MSRTVPFLALAILFLLPQFLTAEEDQGPPISITSPDSGTTYAYASVKDHALIWDKRNSMLTARVTFTDAEQNNGQPNDDTHFFRLPGVTFNESKGVFYAISPKGEAIPVAQIKKTLFFKIIETTTNATVRVIHPRGIITVYLEAISPNDPAMHPKASDPNGTHPVDIDKLLQ